MGRLRALNTGEGQGLLGRGEEVFREKIGH